MHARSAKGPLTHMPGGAQWKERPYDAALAESLGAFFPSAPGEIAAVLARLLASREVDAGSAGDFLSPKIPCLAKCCSALPGLDRVVSIVREHVEAGKRIVVFGDYDVDGVCATAILVKTLRHVGAEKAEAFIPDRLTEGYGMTAASLKRLRREFPDVALVVTVDNGISAVNEVAGLRADGVSVVVTDHHLPDETLPEADALVNPRVAANPGYEELCGAGVAFLVAAGLARAFKCESRFCGPLLVLAGLATVADLMPLVAVNRALATQAVRLFRAYAPIGLRELFYRAVRRDEEPCARHFSLLLAPRLNAAGRMRSAMAAYDLLMVEERERELARRLAMEVDSLNAERKTKEHEAAVSAGEMCGQSGAAVVVCGRSWHPGVLGIVAARLMENVHVPVAVAVDPDGDEAEAAPVHGCVRAPDGYNVHDALAAAKDALVRFGGHAAAGGFTVRPGMWKEFSELFTAACAEQKASAPDAATVMFDGWLDAAPPTVELVEETARLEPFGEGNPEPVFGLRGVAFVEAKPIGADGRHASFRISARGGRTPIRAVWWGHGESVEEFRLGSSRRYDVLFTPMVSDFGAERHVELRIVDVRPAECAADAD